jgi:hypothetical protein
MDHLTACLNISIATVNIYRSEFMGIKYDLVLSELEKYTCGEILVR